MNAEQWQRVNALFHDVLAQPRERRRTFLERATGDAAIRREVEALVSAHEGDPAFLEQPALVPTASAGPPAPAASLVGRQIGAYRVTREIGRGGMGVVYVAEDTRLDRLVALKALAHEAHAGSDARERLRREARAAASLAHPGIATVYALEEDGEDLYLVSELIQGRTLRELVMSGGLPLDQVLHIGIDLARAVSAAHALEIVHRDLKPENVILTDTGAIKVLDFGLARAVGPWGREIAPTITRSGALVGTPAYMAPEQIRGMPVDARGDVFAIGVILFELATGEHPFGGGSVGEMLHRILSEAPPARALDGTVPGPLDAIVRRCLEKDPAARLADAGALAAALQDVAAELGVPAPSGSRPRLVTPGHIRGVAPPPDTRHESQARESGSAWWWWAFHQAAVSVFFAAVIVPAWMAWGLIGHEESKLALRMLLLVLIAAAVSLRLHLRFVARIHHRALAAQRRQAGFWVRLTDIGIIGVLTAGALLIVRVQPTVAGVFLGLAVCYAVVCLVVEPATARAAFGDDGRESPASSGRRSS